MFCQFEQLKYSGYSLWHISFSFSSHSKMDAGEPESKHNGQQESDADDVAAEKPPTSITDLNDDCLIKCFNYLDWCSLIKVAIASEWLRPAANEVYKRKFRSKKITFPGGMVSKRATMRGVKRYLQMLRCVGSSMGHLAIRCLRLNDKQWEYIQQYISTYCSQTLVSIDFQDKSDMPIKYFDKPFVNVRKVGVYHSKLGQQLPLFPKWFPNLQALHLRDVREQLSHRNLPPFQHLQDLRINIHDGTTGFTKRSAARVFHSSPELQQLTIRVVGNHGIALDTLLNMIETNRNISELAILQEGCSMGVSSSEIDRLINEHPSLAALNLSGYKIDANDALTVIRQLESMQKFCIQFCNLQELIKFARYFVAHLNGQWKSSLRAENLNVLRLIVILQRRD